MKLFDKIEASFKASLKGHETTHNLIYYWGIPAYLVAYFIIDRIIKINNIRIIDIVISLLTTAYFLWHIYALKKCSPKKPKLTSEEKKALREQKRKEFRKRLIRRLLLKESFTEWDPVFISIVLDLFSAAVFIEYAIR